MQESRSYLVQLPEVWPENNIYLVDIEGRNICLSKLDNSYYAFSDVCPHASASFSKEGFLIKECIIVCSRHANKFNIKNGRNLTDGGYKLKIFRVKHLDKYQIEIELY